jgi:hypothetical protein
VAVEQARHTKLRAQPPEVRETVFGACSFAHHWQEFILPNRAAAGRWEDRRFERRTSSAVCRITASESMDFLSPLTCVNRRIDRRITLLRINHYIDAG